jgi:uncharacterized protein (DUF2147 family)
MRKFALAAVLALTSSAAYAGSFDIPINGGVAHVRINDNCRETMCASVSWSEGSSRGERREFKLPSISAKTLTDMFGGNAPSWKSITGGDDGNEGERQPSSPAAEAKQPAPPASVPATASSGKSQLADRSAPSPSPALAPTPTTPAETSAPAGTPKQEAAPGATPALPSLVIPDPKMAALAPASAPAPKATASGNSPVGEWLVEGGEGQVRIEKCGANLCGYISAAKNPNEKDRKNPDPALRDRSVIGIPILINMKPQGDRWNGRIYNVQDGKTYGADLLLKNASTLRVEGCAFGGLICGGQNWSRVN